ncbi:MAG: hypothetical protein ACREMB_16630 [Candidatus Rokuibacteriota bacterium]
MTQQLISLVTQKTGISEDQARRAVETVAGYLKEKLPGPVASQLDSVLRGDGGSAQGDVASRLGGMMGKP